MCPLHYFLKVRNFAVFSKSTIYWFAFYCASSLVFLSIRESEKSSTCITRKGSGVSVPIRSLHTSPRDNANKKAYRVLL